MEGRLLDVGCGFGYLVKLLAERNRGQEIYAVDVDPEKLRVAKARLENFKNVKWGVPKSQVNVITVIDVLYLMTDAKKIKLLEKLFKKLKRGGKLFVATVPKEKSWGYYSAWLQEWLMVKVLGKTKSKESIINFETENWLRQKLRQLRFMRVRRYKLPRTLFFWHKHVVCVATK